MWAFAIYAAALWLDGWFDLPRQLCIADDDGMIDRRAA